ncbi:hypothetical protein [uncultured Stenotrophomonas sp.]|uniref:hypothetical protein n=1 Tax=uncultured Stenotrophomonas sp. TaxID=165438 RepID=UPI0028D3A930|nr:hypothetical protein [uncultured Stenotrophomonas sp.]
MKTISKHIKIAERQVARIEQQMAISGMTFTDWVRNAIEIKLGHVETVNAIKEAKADLLRTQVEVQREVANLRLNILADQKTFIDQTRSLNEQMSERHIDICKKHISGLTTVFQRGIEGGTFAGGGSGVARPYQSKSKFDGGQGPISFPNDE